MSRRDEIAQAAMELAAETGGRGLTHRRIDRRLALPEGTTSNYARSRRDLLLMVTERISETAYLRAPDASPVRTAEDAVDQLTVAFEQVADRGIDIRARMALTIDCLDDPELHSLLTSGSPVKATILEQARQLLDELGVPNVDQRAIDLISIMNGLFYDRLIGYGLHDRPADAGAVLQAWLIGVGARSGRDTTPTG